jgi:hypothetical protein
MAMGGRRAREQLAVDLFGWPLIHPDQINGFRLKLFAPLLERFECDCRGAIDFALSRMRGEQGVYGP